MKNALCALPVMALLMAGCASNSPRHDAFEITQTNFLGSLWNQAHAKAHIISQDGGQSFPVPGGAIWAFGDTFTGTRSADMTPNYGGNGVSCAIAFLPQNAKTYPPALNYLATNGWVASPFKNFPDEPPERYRIWPLGGVYVNGLYYLYYSRIEIFGTGSWDFRGAGSGLGCSSVPLGSYERLQPHGDWRFPVEPASVIQADGWLYLYGIEEAAGIQGVALARVRPENIDEPAAYEFYTGPGPQFSSRKDAMAVLVTNVPGQVSVAWNPYLAKYVMVSSSDFWHPRQICFLVADQPYGPWTGTVASIEVPKIRQGKFVDLVYCAYLHPELFRNGGQTMNLTYSLGLKDAGFDANCEMVEVTVKR